MQQVGAPDAPARSVFVDASGRRGRRIRQACWLLGALMVLYVGTVLLALVGPPGLSRLSIPGIGPVLPGPAAAPLRTGTGRHVTPARIFPRPSRSSAAGATGPATAGTAAPAAQEPRLSPATPGAVARTRGPSPSPTATATPSTPAQPSTGPPSPAPRSTKTPPGQSSAKPSPHSSNAKKPSASPSP